MMLDSGAFSAWTRKINIDLDTYIQFCKDNHQHFDCVVNLDVIPAEFGRKPSATEVEASAQQSWDNLLYMESHGLKPIPVFHMGETFDWLEKIIIHGCDYVGISPANDRTTAQKRDWLDKVFEFIADDHGYPEVKTHGFGVTSVPLLFRYPWYSADSTSWILTGAFGSMIIPKWKQGKFVYDEIPHVVSVSSRKSKSAMEGAKNFDSFGDLTKKHILEYLDYCKVTLEQVKTDCLYRSQVSAVFFRDLSANSVTKPFKVTRKGFF